MTDPQYAYRNGGEKLGVMSLLDVASHLERMADACENGYQNCNPNLRPQALLQSKDSVIRALGEVAHIIGIMSADIFKVLNEQTHVVASLDSSIKLLDLRIKGHDELMARKHIGQFIVRKKPIIINPAKFPGIVYPEQAEKPMKYNRQPLNYNLLDDIGHGIRVQDPVYPGTLRRNPQVPVAGGTNIYAPGILSAGGSDSGSTGGNMIYDVSNVSARSGGTIGVRGGNEYAATLMATTGGPIYAGTLRSAQMMRGPGAGIGPPLTTGASGGLGYRALPINMNPVNPQATNAPYRSGSVSGSSGLPTPAPVPINGQNNDPNIFAFQNANPVNSGISRRSSSGAGSNQYAPGISAYGVGLLQNSQIPPTQTPFQHPRTSLSSEGGVVPALNFPMSMDSLPPPPPPPEDLPPPPPMPTDVNTSSYSESSIKPNIPEPGYLQTTDRMQRKGPRDPPWAPDEYIEKVQAIFEYAQERNDELTFQEGSIIYVMQKNEDGWWEGVMENATGLFPGNYVEPLP